MRCLYEVLGGLSIDADEAEIKVAYRKQALKWHPDKNQNNLQEAEDRFKEVQNAYEILSDKHERAWYDSHRSDILRQGSRYQAGGSSDGFQPGQAPDDDINLYPYFSKTCFSGYNDGPMGFYGVYEELFSSLAKQEQEAASNGTDKDKGEPEQPPLFGTSQAEKAQVYGFYSFWLNFATCKSFSWADQYHPASAPNRKVRRLMEEENRKARKSKRKEFNETVRELAAFVKKRDKRVVSYQAEDAQRKLETEAEEDRRREQERKERLQRAREYEEASWEVEAEGGDEEGGLPEIMQDELYCLACDKCFRTQNAMLNHERSKKHVERVEVLRAMLEEEEAGIEPDSEAGHDRNFVHATSSDGPADEQSAADGSDGTPAESADGNSIASSDAAPSNAASDEGTSLAESNEKESSPDASKQQSGEDLHEGTSDSEEQEEEDADEDHMLAALLKMQTGRQAKPAKRDPRMSDSGPESTRGTSHAEGSADEPGSLNGLEPQLASSNLAGEEDAVASGEEPKASKARRRGKAAKGAKAAAPQEEADVGRTDMRREARRKKGKQANVEDDNRTCGVCGEEFDSRTKLFKHIKSSGHAKLKS